MSLKELGGIHRCWLKQNLLKMQRIEVSRREKKFTLGKINWDRIRAADKCEGDKI